MISLTALLLGLLVLLTVEGVALSLYLAKTARDRRALAEAERDYRSIFDNAVDGIYRSSPDGRLLRANPALVRLNGCETEAEMLRAVNNVDSEWYVRPGRRAEFKRLLERDGKVENFNSEIYRHKTGERIWISENARLMRDQYGVPLFYEGTVRDITQQRQTERMAREFQGRLDLALHTARAAFWESQPIEGTHRLSENYYAMLGYSLEEAPRDRAGWLALLHPDDRAKVDSNQSVSPMDDRDYETEFRIRARDGSWHWLLSRFRAVAFDDQGRATRMQGIDSDITQRKQIELAVKVARDRERLYLDVAGAILVVLDLEARVQLLNRRGCEVIGFSEAEAYGREWFEAFAPEAERESQRANFLGFLDGKHGEGQDVEKTLTTKGGEVRLISWRDQLLRDEQGRVVGAISSGEDITERRKLEAQLAQLVIRDELTGAFNRRYFLGQAPTEIQRALRFHHPLSFMFLDLDYFKTINDTYGHPAGDEVLKAFTKLCRETLRPTDLFCRYGGDEFAVMLPETGAEQAAIVANRISQIMEGLERAGNSPLKGLSASIGIAQLLGADDRLEAILERIDKAAYRAKESGRGRIEVCREM
jgi:diguanylate cyclase (GGDEF)-like protein/PAS domain S-box-containing protein